VVIFRENFSGTWSNGNDYDYVTIAPNGLGETFANASGLNNALPDIEIRVYLKNCNGVPLVGVPAQEIVLFNSGLCICPGGNSADAGGTDINGCATFSGSISGGGCVQGLDVYADGVPIDAIAVNINSTDTGLASPCFTDSADLVALATKIAPAPHDICFDYNEDGGVNSSDLAFFAGVIGAACQ
jgi:hypothetical protein